MAYNLKVGLMATTTVVGSAVAFTKTQAGVGDGKGPSYENQSSGQAKTQAGWDGMRGPSYKNQNSGQDLTKAYTESSGGNQIQVEGTNYKDTFHQMMMWK